MEGAFAETFLREPGRTLIALETVVERGHAEIALARAVTVVTFMGKGLARLGATAEVSHRGAPYENSQAWAKALHGHPSRPDGLLYTARHDDTAPCVAIFDRTKRSVRERARTTDLDVDWFWELAEQYGVGLAP